MQIYLIVNQDPEEILPQLSFFLELIKYFFAICPYYDEAWISSSDMVSIIPK
jgi:hypothetical protein